jgi:hypothetical protein
MVSRWPVDHCVHAAQPSVRTPVLNSIGHMNPFDDVTLRISTVPSGE